MYSLETRIHVTVLFKYLQDRHVPSFSYLHKTNPSVLISRTLWVVLSSNLHQSKVCSFLKICIYVYVCTTYVCVCAC